MLKSRSEGEIELASGAVVYFDRLRHPLQKNYVEAEDYPFIHIPVLPDCQYRSSGGCKTCLSLRHLHSCDLLGKKVSTGTCCKCELASVAPVAGEQV